MQSTTRYGRFKERQRKYARKRRRRRQQGAKWQNSALVYPRRLEPAGPLPAPGKQLPHGVQRRPIPAGPVLSWGNDRMYRRIESGVHKTPGVQRYNPQTGLGIPPAEHRPHGPDAGFHVRRVHFIGRKPTTVTPFARRVHVATVGAMLRGWYLDDDPAGRRPRLQDIVDFTMEPLVAGVWPTW